jgi:NifU-like protein involved in Fe-S cluster formation
LLIKKKNDYIEKCCFSAQQSCLVTISVANIICDYLERTEDKTAQKLIKNCWLMLENKKYNLENYPKLQVFSDISRFPNRLDCVSLVIRGIAETLK